MQDASYVCTCDRSGNRVTRGCGRTGMSAGVRKGAKWVGDCGWLSLGRGEILKRSSIHDDIWDWKILHGIYGVHVVAPAILWRGVLGEICRFWAFSISKGRKVRKGGWKSNGKRRNVEMSQGEERWKALAGVSLSPHLTVLHIVFFFSTTLCISPCHRIHVRTWFLEDESNDDTNFRVRLICWFHSFGRGGTSHTRVLILRRYPYRQMLIQQEVTFPDTSP